MDIYAEITNRLVAEMEKGIIPWRKSWMASGVAVSHATGKQYSILNQMLLYEPGEYLTFNQVKEEGGFVRKGEKSKFVVFWKWLEKTDPVTREIERVPYLRYYNVFNINQCEGINPKFVKENPKPAKPYEAAEQIVNDYATRENLEIVHVDGDKACYEPMGDIVVMPMMEQFSETSEYYSTMFHELVHSTGRSTRLDRLAKNAFFGSEEYSKEELTAEIGSSALVHHVGLETPASFRNNAAYIQNWLTALKNDKRCIVVAAGKAERAVDYILHGKQEEVCDTTAIT